MRRKNVVRSTLVQGKLKTIKPMFSTAYESGRLEVIDEDFSLLIQERSLLLETVQPLTHIKSIHRAQSLNVKQ